MVQNPDIIAAIATGSGNGGVGVVRISGKNLTEIMISLVGRQLTPRHATLADFLDIDGTIIDHGIAIFYPFPNSYTGEDVLELQGHGGSVVLKLLLRSCLHAGARMANPGEFTQRAYLNNKLDLVQAESIVDLINATNDQAVRSATRSLEGEFSRIINKLIHQLIGLRIRIEAGLDFPEEDIDLGEKKYYQLKLHTILDDLEDVFQSAKQGSVLRDGAQIALVGSPNVGKSSLLNSLAGEEIALVSDIAGTTRDAIRQEINIQGMPFNFIDTAGLRVTEDVVELLGMKKTKEVIQKADIVLIIIEAQKEIDPEINKIIDLIPANITKLYIMNKIDLIKLPSRIEEIDGDTYIYLSAKTEVGIDLLRNIILKKFNWNGESNVFMARERHLEALSRAKDFLKGAEGEIDRLELFAEELRLAQDALAEILGEFTSDDLLGEIFSRFCIGK